MGRKPSEYEYRKKTFNIPIYLCKKLDTIPNQTQFLIGCLERGLEINNTTLERLQKKEKQLESELTEIRNEIGKIQKEELTKADLKLKEYNRFLKDRYNRLCKTIKFSEFPSYYITNEIANKKILEKYLIELDQETIDKIKQDKFSFLEYQNYTSKKFKMISEGVRILEDFF